MSSLVAGAKRNPSWLLDTQTKQLSFKDTKGNVVTLFRHQKNPIGFQILAMIYLKACVVDALARTYVLDIPANASKEMDFVLLKRSYQVNGKAEIHDALKRLLLTQTYFDSKELNARIIRDVKECHLSEMEKQISASEAGVALLSAVKNLSSDFCNFQSMKPSPAFEEVKKFLDEKLVWHLNLHFWPKYGLEAIDDKFSLTKFHAQAFEVDWEKVDTERPLNCATYAFLKICERRATEAIFFGDIDPQFFEDPITALTNWNYFPVQTPEINDLVIYCDFDEKATKLTAHHYGVYLGDDFVISKFGSEKGAQSTVFRHPVSGVPPLYRTTVTFFQKKERANKT